MKNIFNKTSAPYLASGALAIGTLLISGIFAVAPYIGFLAPFAALSVGLPFIIGGAVFSAVAIALSAVAINKNNTISQQEKFASRVAQRKQEEENARAELKAEGLLPDVIALPDKDTEISSPESRPAKEENVQGWGAWGLDKAKTAAKLVVGGAILAAAAAPVLVGTLFEESSASPAGDRFGSINGTYSCY